MRLVGLEVNGFRGWVGRERIDLDADVIVVEGANGTGKTSLCDAILWSLTGSLPRLGDHRSDVVSLYGEDGLARVSLELRTEGGDAVTVTRSTDGSQERLGLETSSGQWSDDEAAQRLTRQLWPSGLTKVAPGDRAAALMRTVYLQQDEMRQFLEADSDAARFEVVADLVGATRYTALQQQLESQRSAWSRQTNERKSELAAIRERVAALEIEAASLTQTAPVGGGLALVAGIGGGRGGCPGDA